MVATLLVRAILEQPERPVTGQPVPEQKIICALVVLVSVCALLAELIMTAMDIVIIKTLTALMAVVANVLPVLVVIRLLVASLLEYVVLRLVPAMSLNLVLVQTRLVQVIRFNHHHLFVQLVL